MRNIQEWLFDGHGQILLGAILFACGLIILVVGIIFTLRGLGVINST